MINKTLHSVRIAVKCTLLLFLASSLSAPAWAASDYFSTQGEIPGQAAVNREKAPQKYSTEKRPKPLSTDQSKGQTKPVPSKYEHYLNSVVVVLHNDGMGTGFFVSKDGMVVTNQHVVGDRQEVEVRRKDGTSLKGVVVSSDPLLDLAVLSTGENSPDYLQLASSQEGGVGSEVIAIGAPHGLAWSVTKGIISGVRQDGNRSLIQTDAAINQGNSGGPLILVENGRVVGINSLAARKDLAEGISFAVSAQDLRRAFEQYLQK